MFRLYRHSTRPAQGSPKRRSVRPAVEALEERTVPANLAPTIFTDGGAGTGSLRDAVLTADANGEDNVITLQGGTYALTLQNPAGFPVNPALTGDLDLTAGGHTLTIQGQGPTRTVIDANTPGAPLLDRLFQVSPGVTVVFRDLTLRGGDAQDDGTPGQAPGTSESRGGCILNAGTVTLDDVVVIHNAAIGGAGASGDPGQGGRNGFVATGGGIYNTGILNVIRSTLRDNKAQGGLGGDGGDGGGLGGHGGLAFGGGLYNDHGTVTLIASTVAFNGAIGGQGGNGGGGGASPGSGGQGGDGVLGGGLTSSGGTLTLIDSTVASNRVVGGDGGTGGSTAFNVPGGSGGNGGSGDGGGVATEGCDLSFRNSTVAFNTASGGHGGQEGDGNAGPGSAGANGTGFGGGVLAALDGANHVSVSSLFGGNTADTDPEINGNFNTADHTLVANGQGGAGGISNGVNGNIVGVDPLLGPLADNGGPTLTVALLPGSPALNQGANPLLLGTDQRGLPRVSGGQADIGAFEFQVPRPPAPEVQDRAIVAALVNNVMVTKRKGRTHLFAQLSVRVSFAETGALKSEFPSPFQTPAFRAIAVTVFNSDGDGVADAVRLTARRGRRTVTQVFSV
jgi:hypothetical protein